MMELYTTLLSRLFSKAHHLKMHISLSKFMKTKFWLSVWELETKKFIFDDTINLIKIFYDQIQERVCGYNVLKENTL
jgi:hypothetical protein